MEERERIIREIIKVLPELAKSLNRDAATHAAAAGGAGPRAEGAAGPADAVTHPAAAPAKVSTAQVRALVHLAQYGPQTMGELADGLQVSMASATGLVNPLVEMGHVTRARDPRDRRVVRVGLSAQAQIMADAILMERRREVERALADMDNQTCRHFLKGLERLAGRQGDRRGD